MDEIVKQNYMEKIVNPLCIYVSVTDAFFHDEITIIKNIYFYELIVETLAFFQELHNCNNCYSQISKNVCVQKYM